MKSDIIIIGGGLTGLTLAYLLRDAGYRIKIIEARTKLGGRIHTIYKPGKPSLEMGATWLVDQHIYLKNLLDELKIDIIEQLIGEQVIYEPTPTSPHQIVSMPPSNDPSYRIKGGSMCIINQLVSKLNHKLIYTDHIVYSISKVDDSIIVKTNKKDFKAQIVISTVPPFLFMNRIYFSPELPTKLIDVAHHTHTWMGQAIKISLCFDQPFWESHNLRGTIFSQVGPITEMYDHSDYENKMYALMGFLDSTLDSTSKEERLALILNQLQKYYGDDALKYSHYEEKVWRNDQLTFADYIDHVLPHQNNGHSVYSSSYLDGQLYMTGAETSTHFPGYMEGAVFSAYNMYRRLMKIA